MRTCRSLWLLQVCVSITVRVCRSCDCECMLCDCNPMSERLHMCLVNTCARIPVPLFFNRWWNTGHMARGRPGVGTPHPGNPHRRVDRASLFSDPPQGTDTIINQYGGIKTHATRTEGPPALTPTSPARPPCAVSAEDRRGKAFVPWPSSRPA